MDEKFEQFYGQYDDEWGSCDEDDDVTATENDKEILDKVVEDFEKNFKENFKMLVPVYVLYALRCTNLVILLI